FVLLEWAGWLRGADDSWDRLHSLDQRDGEPVVAAPDPVRAVVQRNHEGFVGVLGPPRGHLRVVPRALPALGVQHLALFRQPGRRHVRGVETLDAFDGEGGGIVPNAVLDGLWHVGTSFRAAGVV